MKISPSAAPVNGRDGRRTSAARRRRVLGIAAGVLATALVATGCSGSAGGGSDTLKIAYQKFGTFTQLDAHLKETVKTFEKANPKIKVELVPIAAQNDDYYTKLALMNRASATAPDVMYEDTFKIKADAAAGYLAPLDEYTKTWADWSKFFDNAKQAGIGTDGKTYGIPMGTDTRALWYNKELFAKAGLPVPWQPKTWDDVLSAAKTIKSKLPGVIPMNIYSGKPQGEGSTMQGFEMLLYGTPSGTLYDSGSKKWIAGSQNFTDSLGFIKDVYQGDLGPTPQQALDTNAATTVAAELLPQSKLAIDLDGSWLSGTWLSTGTNPWPKWSTVLGQAPMPTQNGQAPGGVSMSGGWTLSVGAKSANKAKAFEFIADTLDKEGSTSYDIAASQIAVRSDVASDPTYVNSNPSFKFFSSIVPVTHYRPATTEYSQISNQITVAMESVMTGQQTPEKAAAAYDTALKGIVGDDKTETK
ncbi:Multiple sugar-binding protein [Frondihabitans sp. 762G35]|uniref:extracellular solute-binding protein n=1 Tax=Frondihabitans sp. 762G35 TaxID=1446794 RepID=UPI000D20FADF|nr:extracellular solute-binding protein [Frondihabitans sp. 762G35]ARC55834.1 Multiple sugar-binding protein [Frondihabitans sp. 762G35]